MSPPSNHLVGGEPVSDARSLERYLQQEEKKEQRLLRGSLDPFSSPQTSPTDGSGLYRGHLCTNTPSPRKYHVAPRSSSPSSRRGDFDSPQYGSADKVYTIWRVSLIFLFFLIRGAYVNEQQSMVGVASIMHYTFCEFSTKYLQMDTITPISELLV